MKKASAEMEAQTIHAIDWIALRGRAYSKKSQSRKTAQDWDRRAEQFAKRVGSRSHQDGYVAQVLKHIEPYLSDKSCPMTVLDIGCGPGTLALPIAKILAKNLKKQEKGVAGQVTALDFSSKMLEILKKNAIKQGVDNIVTTAPLAWEEDWHSAGIIPHDITLASRSMGVEDIYTSLRKLNNFSKKAVFLTDRVGATPLEPEAFAAVGVELHPAPDYIYTLNILYQLGIPANVTVIEFDRIKKYDTLSEATESFLWMFNELDKDQHKALQEYIHSISTEEEDGTLTVCRKSPPRWALIYWEKEKELEEKE